MNLYLIGYRCTGKTSVGDALGKKLNCPVLDADLELVDEQKRTIQQIVDEDGWDGFRQLESTVLKRLSGLDRHVIATGGGVILNEENIAVMKSSGISVWLRAAPETIYRRMVGDEQSEAFRPALTDKGLYEEIEETLSARRPLYKKAMDYEIHTDTVSIDDVSRRIIDCLDNKW
jgi:shikimate kinase